MDDIGAILDSLHCTPEMIAEQQAELEASGCALTGRGASRRLTRTAALPSELAAAG